VGPEFKCKRNLFYYSSRPGPLPGQPELGLERPDHIAGLVQPRRQLVGRVGRAGIQRPLAPLERLRGLRLTGRPGLRAWLRAGLKEPGALEGRGWHGLGPRLGGGLQVHLDLPGGLVEVEHHPGALAALHGSQALHVLPELPGRLRGTLGVRLDLDHQVRIRLPWPARRPLHHQVGPPDPDALAHVHDRRDQLRAERDVRAAQARREGLVIDTLLMPCSQHLHGMTGVIQ